MILLFLLLFVSTCSADIKPDPFSKITITSRSAFLHKTDPKGLFCLHYRNNVFVTLADATTIHADSLKVFVHAQQSGKNTEIEKVVFEQGVRIKRENRDVTADKVEILIPKKVCMLVGHVHIQQVKQGEKDVPAVTVCEHAQFSWDTEEFELYGSDTKPIETIIELGGKFSKKFISKIS
jgi:OstA-like protein.